MGSSKWYFLAAMILMANLLFRMYDESALMGEFPLDNVNDISSNIAQLYFLDVCGYNKQCDYWYNGFITFKQTQPLWYIAAYPAYLAFQGDALKATYMMLVLTYIAALILFFYFGGKEKFTRTECLLFFLIFLGNAIAIGNFIRLGRPHELLAWILFIPFAFIALQYKDKKIDKNALLLSLLYFLIILAHQTVAILSGFLFLSLFLVQKTRNKIKVALLFLLALAAASFWLVPFLLGFINSGSTEHILTITLFSFDREYIWQTFASFIVPLILVSLFYFYYLSREKSRNELLFFLPIIFLAALLFSRIVFYVPVLKFVYPDPYMAFFIFFGGYLFFKTPKKSYGGLIQKVIPALVVGIAVASVLINIIHTPLFKHHDGVDKATIEMLENVDGRFIVFSHPGITAYSKAVYSYAPVMLDLKTAQGWYPHVKEREYTDFLMNTYKRFEARDCGVVDDLGKLNVSEVISYDNGCGFFAGCGLKEKAKKGVACLYKV